MNDQPAITMDQVSFSYDGPPVVSGVTLTIPRGDMVCIIGPNGGGKTTLLKLMLGLLKPKQGSVRVLGLSPEKARPQIGYMPQRVQMDPHFPVSVLDVVLMGRLGQAGFVGPYRRQDRAVARQALTEVGLTDFGRRGFASLSGGQRQRVLIARALACQPDLLLLDEPTAGLDPAVQEDLYRLLRDLSQRLTVVMVSHDLGFVSLFFKTVVCVHGHVHKHSTSELTNRTVADMYGREVRLIHPGEPAAHGATP